MSENETDGQLRLAGPWVLKNQKVYLWTVCKLARVSLSV